MPDSLRPDNTGYAASLLSDNPMIAYASMQLTGWGYEDQNKPVDPNGNNYNQLISLAQNPEQ